jgi:hypothetical protein
LLWANVKKLIPLHAVAEDIAAYAKKTGGLHLILAGTFERLGDQ